MSYDKDIHKQLNFWQFCYLKILFFIIKLKTCIKSYHAQEKASLAFHQKIYFLCLKAIFQTKCSFDASLCMELEWSIVLINSLLHPPRL